LLFLGQRFFNRLALAWFAGTLSLWPGCSLRSSIVNTLFGLASERLLAGNTRTGLRPPILRARCYPTGWTRCSATSWARRSTTGWARSGSLLRTGPPILTSVWTSSCPLLGSGTPILPSVGTSSRSLLGGWAPILISGWSWSRLLRPRRTRPVHASRRGLPCSGSLIGSGRGRTISLTGRLDGASRILRPGRGFGWSAGANGSRPLVSSA